MTCLPNLACLCLQPAWQSAGNQSGQSLQSTATYGVRRFKFLCCHSSYGAFLFRPIISRNWTGGSSDPPRLQSTTSLVATLSANSQESQERYDAKDAYPETANGARDVGPQSGVVAGRRIVSGTTPLALSQSCAFSRVRRAAKQSKDGDSRVPRDARVASYYSSRSLIVSLSHLATSSRGV